MSDRITRLGPPYEPAPKQERRLRHLRDRHHLAAQLLARGLPATRVAEKVGLKPETISLLRRDPLFSQLVERYREELIQDFVGIMERLRNAVALHLERKLEKDELDSRALLHLLDSLADRTGFPAVRDIRSVSIGLTREDLHHLKRLTADLATSDPTPDAASVLDLDPDPDPDLDPDPEPQSGSNEGNA